MEDDISKKVQQRFAELPPDVKQAVESADLDKHIQAIGAKHKLHIDQVGTLQDEVLLVMLGFESTGNFVQALVRATGIPEEQATAIATDVNNELFNPIRESLKKIPGQGSAQPAPMASPPAMPPVTTKPPTTMSPPPMAAPAAPKPAAPAPVSVASVTRTAATPPATPPPAAPPATPAAAPKPQVPLAPHPHDLTLVEKTVTTPAAAPKTAPPSAPANSGAAPTPPKPQNYKSDPYREPIEP